MWYFLSSGIIRCGIVAFCKLNGLVTRCACAAGSMVGPESLKLHYPIEPSNLARSWGTANFLAA